MVDEWMGGVVSECLNVMLLTGSMNRADGLMDVRLLDKMVNSLNSKTMAAQHLLVGEKVLERFLYQLWHSDVLEGHDAPHAKPPPVLRVQTHTKNLFLRCKCKR